MFFINELSDMRLYKKPFLLPLNKEDKKNNSLALLLAADPDGLKDILNYPLMNAKYYYSYYLERAVMYYINQENGINNIEMDEEIITESIESIIDGEEKRKIIYKGSRYDIENVRRYINTNTIRELSQDYKVRIKYPIYINVVNYSGKRENTDNQIWIMSEACYNKQLKSYEAYLKYNILELIIMNANPKLPVEYKYAIALHDSGLAEMHKHNWIFGKRLKGICKLLDEYEKKYGHKKLATKIVKNHFELIDDDKFTDTLIGSFEKLFSLESGEYEPKIKDNHIVSLNESQLMGLPITEDASYNSALKRILYADRYKNLNEVKEYYEYIKKEYPFIKYTYNSLDMYKSRNLFLDLTHYMYSYNKNSVMRKERGYKIFSELLNRLINDTRYEQNGYKNKTVIIPISNWISDSSKSMWKISENINPISCLFQTMKINAPKLKQDYKDTIFIFIGKNGYFKMDMSTINIANKTVMQKFLRNINILSNPMSSVPNEDDDSRESSPDAMTLSLIDKLEKSQGIEINDISTKEKEDIKPNTVDYDKKKLVQSISKTANSSASEEDTLDELDQDDELKEIIANLSAEADNKANISNARASRMIKLQNDILDKQFKNKSIRDLTSVRYEKMELKSKSLNIDSINEEWKDIKYQTQDEIYDMDSDIVQMFNQFADKSHPLAVRDIKVEDISDSENAVMLYTVAYESADGKRFTIKMEIPKWVDNKYMVLRGNKKELPNQLFLMPICKTDNDTVQIVSNYKKIFIRRFGTSSGKSFITCDRLIKTLTKNKFKNLKIEYGDNTKICNRYELPIDYVDMATIFKTLKTPNITIYFNQDAIRQDAKEKVDLSKGIPVALDNKGNIIYYNSVVGKEKEFMALSQYILLLLETDKDLSKEDFIPAYKNSSRSIRYTYSKASILSSEIPLIVVCAYSEGLTKVLKKANIEYRIENSKKDMSAETEDFIRFNDAYLIYKLDYASSLLLNGLKACDTSSYSIGDIDTRAMYLNFLDNFGGRIKADGLDNFYDLMIDKPITYQTLEYYNLPTDYIEVLLYANRLLADNKYVKHTKIADNRRTRRQEQIAAITYNALATAYGKYCTDMKHGRGNNTMTIKQSTVVDDTLINSTTSDMSVLNALGEFESYNSVTPKGPSGMNSDRSFTLDKRSFDNSMLNVMAMSTGHAGTVGVSRQMTIDANVSSARGYIKSSNKDNIDKISVTKTLCMTEALTPFGTTRDDPFRTAMTFGQTSKHGMKCKRSNPNLITSGADEALPYMISNLFAFKAKNNGVIKQITDEKMIVEYDDGNYDYIDLTENIEKNSSSGFFTSIKLDTDLKEGKKIKAGEILAYDKSSFSGEMGATDNIAYNIGTLAKIAIMYTDKGYEDSAVISEDLSDAMTSNVIIQVDKTFNKDTNIYNLVKVGQSIQEGDTIMIAQSSYDEDDVNVLIRNLTADDEDDITDLGRIHIKSKVTGKVKDIKIYRTVEIEELSPTLQTIVNSYERKVKAKKKEMEKYNAEDIDIKVGPTGKLPSTGKLKNVGEGVKFEIYLEYEDKMSVGDKLIFYSANKGVIKEIIPKGLEPTSEYRPNEKIHSMMASSAIDGRMVCSIIPVAAINKGLIELSRQCKDILGIKYSENLFE